MRVLFAARRSLPHLLTMVPTALACAAAGHEVRIAAPVRAGGPPLYGGLPVLPPEPGWHPHLVVRAEHGDGPGPWTGGPVVRWTPLGHRAAGSGPLCVDPCPPDLRTAAETGALTVRHEDVPAVRMPRWLERPPGRPRVCLRPGPGSGTGPWPVDRVRRIARAVLGLDAELVAVVAPAARHAYQDAFDRSVRFAGPQLLGPVLATCAGVVHDGGPDVTLTAAAHGVPQLVIAGTRPAGDRLGRIGAGRRLVAADADDARDLADSLRLRRRLAELLYDGRALAAAERLRTQLAAQPPPHRLVQALEEFTTAHHPQEQESERGV